MQCFGPPSQKATSRAACCENTQLALVVDLYDAALYAHALFMSNARILCMRMTHVNANESAMMTVGRDLLARSVNEPCSPAARVSLARLIRSYKSETTRGGSVYSEKMTAMCARCQPLLDHLSKCVLMFTFRSRVIILTDVRPIFIAFSCQRILSSFDFRW